MNAHMHGTCSIADLISGLKSLNNQHEGTNAKECLLHNEKKQVASD